MFYKLAAWYPYSCAGEPGADLGSPATTRVCAHRQHQGQCPGNPEAAAGSPANEYGSQTVNLYAMFTWTLGCVWTLRTRENPQIMIGSPHQVFPACLWTHESMYPYTFGSNIPAAPNPMLGGTRSGNNLASPP